MSSQGLELPLLSDGLASKIGATLPVHAALANPVDLAGGGENDFRNYTRVVQALSESDEVDSVILTGYFGGYSEDDPQLAKVEAEVAAEMAGVPELTGRPLIVHTMYPAAPTLDALRAARVPIYGDTSAAVMVLARLVERGQTRPRGLPDLPPASAGSQAAKGYFEARRLLAGAGIAFPDARHVTTVDDALAVAAAIGYPVVLKALRSDHKSDEGGVRLGIAGAEQLQDALRELTSAVYSVESMVSPEGAELLVGVRWDHAFGPVLLVGAGGVYAEVMSDVAVALAPVDAEQAGGLIRSLRIAPMLLGHRGKAPLDVAAAARAAAALSTLAASRPDIAEMEVNPLLVTAAGAIALDARVVIAPKS